MDGAGTALGVRTGTGPVVIQINGVTTTTGTSFSSENIKPFGYIPFTSIGTRYGSLTDDVVLTSQAINCPTTLKLFMKDMDFGSVDFVN